MARKAFYLLIAAAFIITAVLFYPKDYIKVNSCKGYAMNYEEIYSCFGIRSSYYPQGCMDCCPVNKCYGIIHSKECLTKETPESDWTTSDCR